MLCATRFDKDGLSTIIEMNYETHGYGWYGESPVAVLRINKSARKGQTV